MASSEMAVGPNSMTGVLVRTENGDTVTHREGHEQWRKRLGA